VNPSAEDAIGQVASTSWVRSWIGQARPGDLHDPVPERRQAAWAHWALTSLGYMSGHQDRPYLALVLPGAFYDPKGTGPSVRPHLEVHERQLERPDELFPRRLAQAGNGLLFPWWVVPEVLSVKRSVLSATRTDPSALLDVLDVHRTSLVSAVTAQLAQLSGRWANLERSLSGDPSLVSGLLAKGFTAQDVAEFLPALAGLSVQAHLDDKLAASPRAARRLGAWTLRGHADGQEFSLGVLTPRLTRSSTFTDPLFAPEKESSAALLVRGLILSRLTGQRTVVDPPHASTAPSGAFLRSVVARVGEKMPEASISSALNFVQTYPDPEQAWDVLQNWAHARVDNAPRAALTVTREGFVSAHKAIRRSLARAESPERADVNVLLPLAWDARSRVVRVTFARSDDSTP